jgi:hypothetical protein
MTTREDVIAALREVRHRYGKLEVLAIFATFNAETFYDLQPHQYAAVVRACEHDLAEADLNDLARQTTERA